MLGGLSFEKTDGITKRPWVFSILHMIALSKEFFVSDFHGRIQGP